MNQKLKFNKKYNLRKIPEDFEIKYNSERIYSISNEAGVIKIFALNNINLYWTYISSLHLSTLRIHQDYDFRNLNYIYYLYIFTSVFKND